MSIYLCNSWTVADLGTDADAADESLQSKRNGVLRSYILQALEPTAARVFGGLPRRTLRANFLLTAEHRVSGSVVPPDCLLPAGTDIDILCDNQEELDCIMNVLQREFVISTDREYKECYMMCSLRRMKVHPRQSLIRPRPSVQVDLVCGSSPPCFFDVNRLECVLRTGKLTLRDNLCREEDPTPNESGWFKQEAMALVTRNIALKQCNLQIMDEENFKVHFPAHKYPDFLSKGVTMRLTKMLMDGWTISNVCQYLPIRVVDGLLSLCDCGDLVQMDDKVHPFSAHGGDLFYSCPACDALPVCMFEDAVGINSY
jgi:hypothetical protein